MKFRFEIAVILVFSAVIFMIVPVSANLIGQRYSLTFPYRDALVPPDIPVRSSEISSKALAPSLSPSPGYSETSEYLIGSVAVGIVFLESNDTIDPSTENWTPARESSVVSKIRDSGLSWLANYNPDAHVSFVYDIRYKVPTSYEPINRPSTDQGLWINEAMTYLGYPGSFSFSQVRDYVNDLRNTLGTNWAFVIFIVDSYNDADGMFTDGKFAYAYLGGPFLAMTYDNDNWGISNMDNVVVHETLHIFYATDEYDGIPEFSGYLNIKDDDGAYCVMNPSGSVWTICSATRGQIGWRDTDGDKIQDIVDTFPNTAFVTLPDATNDATPTCTGSATETPYPNSNPHGTDRSVSINVIVNVQYRIDSGAWRNASAEDGSFDEAEELFTFTTSSLQQGAHLIETRGINSVGNIETSVAMGTLTVDLTPPSTRISYSSPKYESDTSIYISKNTKFTLNASDTISGVANTYYKIDSGIWTLYLAPFTFLGIPDGEHKIYFYSIDYASNKETTNSFNVTADSNGPNVSIIFPSVGSVMNSVNVDVSWNGSDVGSGIDHYETKVDDGDNISIGISASHRFQNMKEGFHTVYVTAFDKLGNSKEFSRNFTVDMSPPIISWILWKNGSEIKSSTATVAWLVQDEVSGIDHYEIRLDNNAWINIGANNTYKFTKIDDGYYILRIKAVDKAGNYKEVRIDFSINTSLIGGPGWFDDAVVFGAIGAIATSVMVFFLKRRGKKVTQINIESHV